MNEERWESGGTKDDICFWSGGDDVSEDGEGLFHKVRP